MKNINYISLIGLLVICGCNNPIPQLPTPPWEEPPGPPVGVQGEVISPTEILLTWEDRNIYENGYEIQESAGNSNNFIAVVSTDADAETYTMTDRRVVTDYYYRIRGFNDFGFSQYSDDIRMTTTDFPPDTPGNLIAEAISSTDIQLTWIDCSDNETGFELYESIGNSGNFQLEVIASSNDTTETLRNRTVLTTYYYRLRAVNSYGNSDYSETVWVTPGSFSPNPPLNFQASVLSPTEVRLTWQDSSDNEEGFEIFESIGNNQNYILKETAGTNSTGLTITELSPNTTYFYRIRSVNSWGSSAFTNEVTITMPHGIPLAPSELQAEAVSATQIDLEWIDNSDNEIGFKIERKIGENGNYIQITQTGEDETSYQDIGLELNTTYFYRVYAFNGYAASEYSEEVSEATEHEFPILIYENDFEVGGLTSPRWKFDENIHISDLESHSGTNSVHFTTRIHGNNQDHDNCALWLYHEPIAYGYFGVWFRLRNYASFQIYLLNNDERQSFIQLRPYSGSGDMHLLNGESYYTVENAFQTYTWFHLEVSFNSADRTYDLLINGEVLGDDLNARVVNQFDGIKFHAGATQGSGSVHDTWMDDIEIRARREE